MDYADQKQIDNVDEMFEAIEQATNIKKMNALRSSCVELMKEDKNVLLLWQKKYWSLRNCPSCGRVMPNAKS